MAQPETTNGSPETISDQSSILGAHVTGQWAQKILAAIPTSDSPIVIRRAIDQALGQEELEGFSTVVHESSMHSLMLGSLDSAWEVETDTAIEPPEYEPPEATLARRERSRILLAETRYYEPGFDHLPYQSAKDVFLSLTPISRKSFDVLDDMAKRQAFTVAGVTQKRLLKVVQRELARQVSQGASLREFRKFAESRMMKAGWTPVNPSHIETIFRTNTTRAYGAGRAEHQLKPSVVKLRPFWKVLGVGDGPPRERPKHAKNNNRVLRADNPVWKEKYPPWGYNCRHRVTTLSAKYSGPVANDLEDVPDKNFTAGVANLMGV